MGQNIKIIKPVSFMENLFTMDGKKYHEILLTYEIEFLDKNIYEREKIHTIEKNKDLEFIWFDKNKLDDIVFVPNILKTVLKDAPKEFKHIINVE